MALMALDHLLHHTSSTGISAGQLGMRIVQGPQTADLGLLPCLAKKKKQTRLQLWVTSYDLTIFQVNPN